MSGFDSEKSVEEYLNLQKKASKCCDRKDFALASTFCTKALLLAPPYIEMKRYKKKTQFEFPLAQMFDQRSLCAFNSKNYNQCIKDVKRALVNGKHDADSYSSLMSRLAWSYWHLKSIDSCQQAIDEWQASGVCKDSTDCIKKFAVLQSLVKKMDKESIPSTSCHANESGPTTSKCAWKGLSDKLQINQDTKKGRHVLTKEEVRASDVLVSEAAFAAVLTDKKFQLSCCSFCFQDCSTTGVPCHGCSAVVYCDETCRKAAWNHHHWLECAMMPLLARISDTHAHLALRILLNAAYYQSSSSNEVTSHPRAMTSQAQTMALIAEEMVKLHGSSHHRNNFNSKKKPQPPSTRPNLSGADPSSGVYRGDYWSVYCLQTHASRLHKPAPGKSAAYASLIAKAVTKSLRSVRALSMHEPGQGKKLVNQVESQLETVFHVLSKENYCHVTSSTMSSTNKVTSDVITSSSTDVKTSSSAKVTTLSEHLNGFDVDNLSSSDVMTSSGDVITSSTHVVTSSGDMMTSPGVFEMEKFRTGVKKVCGEIKCVRNQQHFPNGMFRDAPDNFQNVLTYLLQHHMMQIYTNSQAIFKVVETDSFSDLASLTQERLATAIFPSLALLNHSCNQNTSLTFEGRTAQIRASLWIPAGAEVTHCYGPSLSRHPFDERQKLLREQYFFTCECDSCSKVKNGSLDEQNQYDQLMAYKCRACEDALVVVDNRPDKMVGECANQECRQRFNLAAPIQIYQTTMNTIGQMMERVPPSRADNCISSVNTAMRVCEQILHRNHYAFAVFNDKLAFLYGMKKEYRKSAEHQVRAIRILVLKFGEQSVELARERAKLATTYISAGDLLQAVVQLKKAQNIHRKLSTPRDHEREYVSNLLNECVRLCQFRNPNFSPHNQFDSS